MSGLPLLLAFAGPSVRRGSRYGRYPKTGSLRKGCRYAEMAVLSALIGKVILPPRLAVVPPLPALQDVVPEVVAEIQASCTEAPEAMQVDVLVATDSAGWPVFEMAVVHESTSSSSSSSDELGCLDDGASSCGQDLEEPPVPSPTCFSL